LTVQRSTASNTLQFRIFEMRWQFHTTISGLTIGSGDVSGGGGGILNRGVGTLTVTGCNISHNSAIGGGGGIFNLGM